MKISENICQNCGSIITHNNDVLADECLFCGNTNIKHTMFTKGIEPEYILPFSITQEDAYLEFKKKINKGLIRKLYIPRKFRKDILETEMKSIYVPFHLVNTTINTPGILEDRYNKVTYIVKETAN